MSKKINMKYQLYSDKRMDYYSFQIFLIAIFGVPFVGLFVGLANTTAFSMPFFVLLFIFAVIILGLFIYHSLTLAKKEYEEKTDIKKNGTTKQGEIFHISRSYAVNEFDDLSGVSGWLKYIDSNGKVQYQVVSRLPNISNRVKLFKINKENFNTFQCEDVVFSENLAILHEKTNSSHTIPIPHNFSGTILCTIYEKDGKQIIDDFQFIDVEI